MAKALAREESQEPTKWEKYKETLKTLSVEPGGFLVIVSMIMTYLIMANLMMETICLVDLGYSEDMCKEIIGKVNATYKEQEREIQKVQAGISAYTSVMSNCISVCMVLFMGPWSDVNGRKFPLLLSVVGMILFSLMCVVGHLLLGKISGLTLAILTMLPVCFTGGGALFGMSAYSYLSDTTKTKIRTIRTGILSACLRSGIPIGFAVGGVMTKYGVGSITTMIISISLSLIAFVLIMFRVKNIIPQQPQEEVRTKRLSKCRRYNPIYKLIDGFAILFKPRKDRAVFYLLILAHVCYAAPSQGEHSNLYLFVRERLQWNISDFGFFSMYNWLMSAAGVVISMFILSKTFKLSDPIIGFVSGLSQIGGSTTYAFVSSGLMMYLASGFDMMNGTIGVINRSMLSKIVAPDEMGKLFALLGVIESLIPLVMVPTYALLYRNTLGVFSGAFFLLSAAVTIPAEFVFLYFMCTNKGHPTHTREADSEASKEDGKKETKADSVTEQTEFIAPEPTAPSL